MSDESLAGIGKFICSYSISELILSIINYFLAQGGSQSPGVGVRLLEAARETKTAGASALLEAAREGRLADVVDMIKNQGISVEVTSKV